MNVVLCILQLCILHIAILTFSKALKQTLEEIDKSKICIRSL